MTVIAYDHKRKEISVDSRLTSEDILVGKVQKFAHLPDGGIAFVCGLWESARRILNCLSQSKTPDDSDFSDVTVIVAQQGKVYTLGAGGIRELVQKSWAWGSGRDVALGALAVGATSAQAANAAAQLCLSCGGPIHTFKTRT